MNLTKDLIQTDCPKLDIIKRLSEIGQILLDLHNAKTINARKLIIPLLDKSFCNIIKGVKRGNNLFGDKLGDIKNSKEIERSIQSAKKKPSNLVLQYPEKGFYIEKMDGRSAGASRWPLRCIGVMSSFVYVWGAASYLVSPSYPYLYFIFFDSATRAKHLHGIYYSQGCNIEV